MVYIIVTSFSSLQFIFLDNGAAGSVSQDTKLLGEPDGKGFGIGVAAPPIKANTMVLLATRGKIKSRRGKEVVDPTESKRSETQGQDEGKSTATTATRTQRQGSLRPTTPLPKSEAFLEFKQERGSEISRILHENKGRNHYKGYRLECNICLFGMTRNLAATSCCELQS